MFLLFGEVLWSEIVNVIIVFVLFGEVLRSEIVCFLNCVCVVLWSEIVSVFIVFVFFCGLRL